MGVLLPAEAGSPDRDIGSASNGGRCCCRLAHVSGRFVILEHAGHGPTHCDLMLDVDGASPLATWQFPADPRDGSAAGRRIADHRRAYLDYEGDISGGRGSVRRIGAGTWDLLEETPASWRVTLDDGEAATTLTLPR